MKSMFLISLFWRLFFSNSIDSEIEENKHWGDFTRWWRLEFMRLYFRGFLTFHPYKMTRRPSRRRWWRQETRTSRDKTREAERRTWQTYKLNIHLFRRLRPDQKQRTIQTENPPGGLAVPGPSPNKTGQMSFFTFEFVLTSTEQQRLKVNFYFLIHHRRAKTHFISWYDK